MGKSELLSDRVRIKRQGLLSIMPLVYKAIEKFSCHRFLQYSSRRRVRSPTAIFGLLSLVGRNSKAGLGRQQQTRTLSIFNSKQQKVFEPEQQRMNSSRLTADVHVGEIPLLQLNLTIRSSPSQGYCFLSCDTGFDVRFPLCPTNRMCIPRLPLPGKNSIVFLCLSAA